MHEIQLKDTNEATLPAVLDKAVRGYPAAVTRHGRKEAVPIFATRIRNSSRC